MNARRATAALLAATLAATVPGLTAGSSAGAVADDTPGYSLRHLRVDVLVGPNDDVPCQVNADLYRPDTATSRHPAPAILTTNGFGGAKDDGNQTKIAKTFVSAGYVVLSYSGLGFGGSGCKITLDDPDFDGKAGSQLVSVLAGEKTFVDTTTSRTGRIRVVAEERPGDPRVGMIGGSYGGQVQYAVAARDRRVDALIPIITWNDLAYSLAPNNTSFARGVSYRTPGVHKRLWTSLFFGVGILDGITGVQIDPTRDVGCPNFRDDACVAKAQLEILGFPIDATIAMARHSSVASYVGRVKAPTLLVQGERDTLFNLQEAVATFRSLRAQGTPTKMIWQSWGHSDSTPAPGEMGQTAKQIRASYLGRRFLGWMDRYVRGDRTADTGPRFAYFRDWVRYDTSPARAGMAIERAYAERRRFSERPTATLYFTGGSGLTPRATAVRAGSASYANTSAVPTSYSETSALEGGQVDNPISDAPGTAVAFTSAPLAKGATLVGSPRLTLHLEAPVAAAGQAAGPGGQLVLFVKVYDVAPDGTPTLKNRLISPVRVTDVTKPVRVRLPGVVHRFAKWHRISVVIAASDFAYNGNDVSQPVTVTTSPAAPSMVRLPLTGRLVF